MMDALSTFTSALNDFYAYVTNDFLNDVLEFLSNFYAYVKNDFLNDVLGFFSCLLAVSFFLFAIFLVFECLSLIVGFILGSFREFLVTFSACYVAILVHGNHERVMELLMQGI